MAFALALFSFLLFLPATGHDFINLDDRSYVFENEHIRSGLTWENIRWAVAAPHENWYLPLLWISYMIDTELYGTGPSGYHLTNILLHALNVALLFWILVRMTGSVWRSALVAALFAAHPLRVESVAWIAARKDVLSGFFFLASLLAYVRHVERPARRRYWLIPFWMILGLLSKAIVIVLPFILLLLDYWPLRRHHGGWSSFVGHSLPAAETSTTILAFRQAGRAPKPARADSLDHPQDAGFRLEWRRLLAEKVPLLILTFIFIAINLSTHETARGDYIPLSLLDRLSLIAPDYWTYLAHIAYPVNLAIVYPAHDVVNGPISLIALAGLLAVTMAFLFLRARLPFLIVGWMWFIVALFPVIRGVRLDPTAAYADRFTYLPSIGLFWLVVWLVSAVVPERPWRKWALGIPALALVAICVVGTQHYLSYWKDSESLFRRTVSLIPDNYLIWINLAAAYHDQGRTDEEMAALFEALRATPDNTASHVGLGAAYRLKGMREKADEHFLAAARHVQDREWQVHMKIGEHFALTGRYDEAIRHFAHVLREQPGHIDTLHNTGMCHLRRGRAHEALSRFEDVLSRDPDYERSLWGKANALLALGQGADAENTLRRLVRLAPERADYRAALRALHGE